MQHGSQWPRTPLISQREKKKTLEVHRFPSGGLWGIFFLGPADAAWQGYTREIYEGPSVKHQNAVERERGEKRRERERERG